MKTVRTVSYGFGLNRTRVGKKGALEISRTASYMDLGFLGIAMDRRKTKEIMLNRNKTVSGLDGMRMGRRSWKGITSLVF